MKISLPDIRILNEETYDLTGLNSTGTPFSGTSSSAHEDDDMKTLQRMMELANTLKCPHNALDEVLKELLSPLKPNFDSSGHPIELEIKSSDGRLDYMKYTCNVHIYFQCY